MYCKTCVRSEAYTVLFARKDRLLFLFYDTLQTYNTHRVYIRSIYCCSQAIRAVISNVTLRNSSTYSAHVWIHESTNRGRKIELYEIRMYFSSRTATTLKNQHYTTLLVVDEGWVDHVDGAQENADPLGSSSHSPQSAPRSMTFPDICSPLTSVYP